MADDIEGQVLGIVQKWARLPSPPAGSALLRDLWANVGGPFTLGAQDLAQRLKSQLGSNVRGTDITATTTVNQLIQML